MCIFSPMGHFSNYLGFEIMGCQNKSMAPNYNARVCVVSRPAIMWLFVKGAPCSKNKHTGDSMPPPATIDAVTLLKHVYRYRHILHCPQKYIANFPNCHNSNANWLHYRISCVYSRVTWSHLKPLTDITAIGTQGNWFYCHLIAIKTHRWLLYWR